MGYQWDLSVLSVPEYKKLLKSRNLLPGRRLLRANIDHNFDIIENQGIEHTAQLKRQLSKAEKIGNSALILRRC